MKKEKNKTEQLYAKTTLNKIRVKTISKYRRIYYENRSFKFSFLLNAKSRCKEKFSLFHT